MAPSNNSRLVPSLPARSTSWGTAYTSLPCSRANPAVIRLPLFRAASTTRRQSLSPLIRRFLSGKCCRSGGLPGWYSLRIAPWWRIRENRARFSGG